MSGLRQEMVLREAEFDPKVRTYWLLSGAWILTVSVVGILLLPFWFFIGKIITGRYLRHMKCVLTEKTLQVSRGAFNRVEKTIPLDQITDLGLVQGPVMRYMGLEALSVETAGQSSEGALVKLVGIVNTRDFRSAVLAQRDQLVMARSNRGDMVADVPAQDVGACNEILCDIRDALYRIEEQLKQHEGT